MEDNFERTFADLDQYYPGSKQKRRPPKPPEIQPEVEWAAKPTQKILPNGNKVDMYTIGALASALGRPIITLRLWMEEGHLPNSPYRLPTKVDKHGKEHKGRRLYTKPMIEATVEMFRSNGILHVKRVEWANHKALPQMLAEEWDNLRATETKQLTGDK